MRKIFRSKQQWQKLILGQPISGLSISQYCKNQNICIGNFYAWRKRFNNKEISKRGFLRLNKPTFSIRSDIRIETPNGYKIEMTGFDELIFQKIIGMVKAI